MSDSERDSTRNDQIGRVRAAALKLGFEEKAADSIAAMEARYLDHLEAGGASGWEATAKLFNQASAAGLFWFDAWTRARQNAGFQSIEV